METLVNVVIGLILLLESAFSDFEVAHTPRNTQTQPPIIRNGAQPVVAPDGSRIVFASNRTGNDDLFLIAVGSSEAVQLTESPEHESFAGWSQNSKQVLFSVLRSDSSDIFAINIDGRNQREIGKVPGRNPMVSPDGTHVIYATGTWTEMRLLISRVDGSDVHQLNDGKSIAWNVRWSPDGKQFAFTGRNDPRSELAVFVANADGSGVRQVSHVPLEEGGGQSAAWSNDGRQLAIQVNDRLRKHRAHIWIIDVATGQGRKLAAHEQEYLDETPSWFPDNKRLAFQSDRSGRMEVWVMNVDGTHPKQLTR